MAFPTPCAPALCTAPRALASSLRVKRPRAVHSSISSRRAWSAHAAAADDASSTPIAPPLSAAPAARRTVRLYDVRGGLMPYDAAWRWQHALVRELKANNAASDALILLEHKPIYTLGTRSATQHILFDAVPASANAANAEVVKTERGGEVTYHGPGQLVAYPVLSLARSPFKKDLHWYMRKLEGLVIAICAHYGIQATRIQGRAGVWVNGEKIAAVGLKVSKWITMHGIAINVNTDLKAFERIVPCGISDAGVTSLEQVLGLQVDLDEVRDAFVSEFYTAFGPVQFRKSADPVYMPTHTWRGYL